MSIFILLFCGCATLNKSECFNADGEMIGLEDGAKGREISYISRHRKACAEYNIRPNLQQYETGYDLGIQKFCTSAKGFQLGQKGEEYAGVCPPKLEKEFLAGYQLGQQIYTLKNMIGRAKSLIKSKEKHLAELNDKVKNKERLIISSKISELKRAHLLDEVKSIQTEIDHMNAEIRW
ncbi:MAG: DUF2799 domain-containing protein [Desulfuromonadales bacterium]|nr:DUF2799 domain-containing protein [Desulfuromonadales bacterium]